MSQYKKKFFDDMGYPFIMENIKGVKKYSGSKPISEMIECDDKNFLDFLKRCLDWNPLTRCDPNEALRHVWVLEGLPKNVLYHHCKMYEIDVDDVPSHLLEGSGLREEKEALRNSVRLNSVEIRETNSCSEKKSHVEPVNRSDGVSKFLKI